MSRTTIFFAAGLERCCCASNQASALPLTGAQSIEVVAPYLTEGRMGRRAKLVGEFLPRGRKAPCHQEREHREHLDGVPPPLRRVCQVFNGKAVAHCEHKRGLAKSVDTWRLSMCTVADRRASTRYARPRAHDKRTPPPPFAGRRAHSEAEEAAIHFLCDFCTKRSPPCSTTCKSTHQQHPLVASYPLVAGRLLVLLRRGVRGRLVRLLVVTAHRR